MNENRKRLQLELLMEKLRHKTSHLNLAESAKAFRMTISEKRYNNDVTEKAQYQKCLDLLQTNMKVTSMQSMLERLESISRQAGLKFTAEASGNTFFISSDMFYLEVVAEQGGVVREVHIQHEGREPQTCHEISVCLNSGNFSQFANHLQGLCAIYQVSADKKLRAKVFTALSALELDLSSMSQIQNFSHDLLVLVHKSPLGIVQPRIGGQPLTLTYFVSPYDLLNLQPKGVALMQEKIIDGNLGLACSVAIEAWTSQCKLPITQLLSVMRNSEGDSVSTFTPLNAVNSTTLPAIFTLRMRQPLMLCRELAQQIQVITGVEVGCWDKPSSLMSLLVNTISNGQMDFNVENSRSSNVLYVSLPDQHHSYYLTENEDSSMKCVLVSTIPFSHPSHVPKILSILRQQALLNNLLSSCIRPRSLAESNSTLAFEINTITLSHLSVSFEHPLVEQLCSVDIDLTFDPTSIRCHLYGTEEDTNATNDYASKVLQRCLSIPVTMRAILRQLRSSSRRSNQTIAHHGAFERRFHPRMNSDLDPHTATNGQFSSNSSYTNTSGGFDSGHSPRNHKMDGGKTVNDASGDKGSSEDVLEAETSVPRSTPSLVDDAVPRSNTKTSFARLKPESRVSALVSGNPVVTLYSMHSTPDPNMSLGFSTTTSAQNQIRRSGDVLIKSENTDLDVSIVHPSECDSPSIVEESDSSSPIDVALNASKTKDCGTKVVYPSVSITPVTSMHSSSHNSSYPNITLERRPGIEIIPLSKESTIASGIPSSLTITPVAGKLTKDKEKYKEFRVKESRIYDVEDKDREKEAREKERDKERERRERKRRREEEKLATGGGKPAKMMCLTSTLMGPPTLLKTELNAKVTFKTGPGAPVVNSASLGTPPKSNNKVPTPSSSPKHPSSGGKPSMSALKSAASSLTGSTSPSSKSKKSKERDRDRGDKERDRDRGDKERDRDRGDKERDRDKEREKDKDKDRDKERDKDKNDKEKDKERERDRDKDKDRDRERDRDKERERDRDGDRDRDKGKDRSRDREKKSRTPTPTSNSYTVGNRASTLVKTKSLDFPFAVDDKIGDMEMEDQDIFTLGALTSDCKKLDSDIPFFPSKQKETPSSSPSALGMDRTGSSQSDSESSKLNSTNASTWSIDSLSSCLSTGSAKSPVRSRKSSLSAVIDKLRLQHNSEGDISPTGAKYGNSYPKTEQADVFKNIVDFKRGFIKQVDLQGRTNFLDDLDEANDSSSPMMNDDESLDRVNSSNTSPLDPFAQDDEGNYVDLDRESTASGKQFVRPFPPSRAAYGMRPYRTNDNDINPHSPSVSVHIVNVSSPLTLQQNRSPLTNQLAIMSGAGTSPQSSVSQTSPCIIDEDLMDEALVGLGK